MIELLTAQQEQHTLLRSVYVRDHERLRIVRDLARTALKTTDECSAALTRAVRPSFFCLFRSVLIL